ncbi:MAG: hypothetical protein KY476_24350, partial [Planctomycetes bacterium]|nr:hypothetical protein [Planctomycetota bacterium]
MTEAAASPVLARGETVPTELPSDRRLPLVIGVTGHRDLQESDLPALRARLREVFEELARRHPHTPLWLLSPLAEGADCLAAEVALECGMEFIAPLPMPRAAYEQDFTTPEALAKFRELLRQARATFELPPPPDAPLFDEREQASRDRQYCAAAAFVVRHCQLLIALWDGVPAKPDGCGTAQAVQFMRHGVPAEYRPRAGAVPAYETGLVYHIAVRRRGQPWSGEPAALAILPPPDQPLARGVEERVWHAVDGLNRDVLAYSASSAAGNGVTWSRLLGGTVEGQLAPRLRAIDERFAVVDALAARCQRATRRVLILLLVLSFAAAMALQLHLARGAATGSFVLIYAGALAAALVLYVWAKWARFEARHRDYRALAEGLRVQFFWWLAGLEESVADHYLRRQQGVLQWVRNALRTWTMPGGLDPPWPPLSKG